MTEKKSHPMVWGHQNLIRPLIVSTPAHAYVSGHSQRYDAKWTNPGGVWHLVAEFYPGDGMVVNVSTHKLELKVKDVTLLEATRIVDLIHILGGIETE